MQAVDQKQEYHLEYVRGNAWDYSICVKVLTAFSTMHGRCSLMALIHWNTSQMLSVFILSS